MMHTHLSLSLSPFWDTRKDSSVSHTKCILMTVCRVLRPPLLEVSENICPAGSLWTQHIVTKTWMTLIYAKVLLWISCHPSAFSLGMFEIMTRLALDLHVHWKSLSEIISPLQYMEHTPNGVFSCAFLIADEPFHWTCRVFSLWLHTSEMLFHSKELQHLHWSPLRKLALTNNGKLLTKHAAISYGFLSYQGLCFFWDWCFVLLNVHH